VNRPNKRPLIRRVARALALRAVAMTIRGRPRRSVGAIAKLMSSQRRALTGPAERAGGRAVDRRRAGCQHARTVNLALRCPYYGIQINLIDTDLVRIHIVGNNYPADGALSRHSGFACRLFKVENLLYVSHDGTQMVLVRLYPRRLNE